MLNDFVVLALEQLALAVVEEQGGNHVVELEPSFISRMFLGADHTHRDFREKTLGLFEFIQQITFICRFLRHAMPL